MSKRVLIAEGNVSTAENFATDLARKEFTCDLVHDGEAVLEYLRAHIEPPDCILLDASLPGKNGFVVLEEMRTQMGALSIPVVIISDLGEPKDMERCSALNAAACLVRTRVTPKDIVDEVEFAMGSISRPLDKGSVPEEIGKESMEEQQPKIDPLIGN